METIDTMRYVFRRIGELNLEIQTMDSAMFQKFKKQISIISDLEDYDFRKIVTDDGYEPIDTLKLRRVMINKWEKEISNYKSIAAIK